MSPYLIPTGIGICYPAHFSRERILKSSRNRFRLTAIFLTSAFSRTAFPDALSNGTRITVARFRITNLSSTDGLAIHRPVILRDRSGRLRLVVGISRARAPAQMSQRRRIVAETESERDSAMSNRRVTEGEDAEEVLAADASRAVERTDVHVPGFDH